MPNPRTAAKTAKIAAYIEIGGPAMTAAQAAKALGTTADAVAKYRRDLIAAGIIGTRPRGRQPADPTPATPAAPGTLYQRGRSPAWARRVITRLEAVHGPAEPTCTCGGPLPDDRAQYGGRCDTCALAARMATA